MYTYGKEFSVLFVTLKATLAEYEHTHQKYLCSIISRLQRRLTKLNSGSLNATLWCAARVAFHLPITDYLSRYSGEELDRAVDELKSAVRSAVVEMGWDTDLRFGEYRLSVVLQDLLHEACSEY